MSKAEKLLGLAKRHAEISAEIKTNKEQMITELDCCTGGEFSKPESESGVDFSFLETDSFIGQIGELVKCSNYAYKAFEVFNRENDDFYSYDELLHVYGCEHCQEARKIKLNIGKLGSERGRIHSEITNIGKSALVDSNESNG